MSRVIMLILAHFFSHKKPKLLYHASYLFDMKRDYYSDIKLAERIIFQNTAYLLTMLDKKVDSFTSLKTPSIRDKERQELLNPDNVLDPQKATIAQNPLASLANDLTKPIWNCITRVEPVALSVLPQITTQEHQQRVSAFNYSMNRFFERFKSEHQDQASLKLHINLVDRASQLKSLVQQFDQHKISKTQDILRELFSMLNPENQRKIRQMDPQKTLENERIELLAVLQILEKLTIKNPKTSTYMHPQLVAEVCNFAQTVEGYIKNLAQSFSGPVYINYYLQADTLPLMLHPMILAIYCCIKNQIATQEGDKVEPQSSNSFFETPSKQTIFQELKSYNCSKITFINLDGYQTQLNLVLAKYLGKYMQYISFPEEQLSIIQNDSNLKSYFKWRSQMLARQYLASSSDFQITKGTLKLREMSNQTFDEIYKRLIVIPIKSIYISQRSGKLPSINGYQSHFVSLMMKEVIYNQIRQFGPSVIIISHANTLPILPNHLQQILSQLSILTNMKIIFYNNITHNLLSHLSRSQETDAFSSFHQQYFLRKQQWVMPHSPKSLGLDFPISVDMLERASIFLKICSGTTNLNFQARETDQKYQNSRILRYAGAIMRQVCKKHPSLSKYDHRFVQFLKIDKLFFNYHQPKPISAYHKNILNSVQAALQQCYGCDWISSEHWKSFSSQYAIRLNQEKQNQQPKYFTKFTKVQGENYNGSNYNLIALQFEITQNQAQKLITLSQNSQILISATKKYQKYPIFVLNHLKHFKSQTLSHYFGFVNQNIQKSCSARVSLFETHFYQNLYYLTSYQHFTQFNYHETQTTVLLFWPLLYDAKQALMHTFYRTSYQPQMTSLFFVGKKSNLANLEQVEPFNQSYKYLRPRMGCTCYQIQDSNTIYVFGGFYNDLSNYLDFQTDISVIKLDSKGISFQNVPKSFFVNQQSLPELSYPIVKSFDNDLVRPRVEYEVYQLQQSQAGLKQILLLGGIGQKFTRPFSVIGYMAHLITFQRFSLAKIDRIKLNNLVPANLSRSIKARVQKRMPVIKIAQNTRIETTQTTLNTGELTFAHFKLNYVTEDPNLDKQSWGRQISRHRRMNYTKSYEVGLDQKLIELQQKRQNIYTVSIREGTQIKNIKWILRHFSYKGKNQANVLLTVELKKSYLMTLAFKLQDSAAQRLVNAKENKIKLAPHHIIAADTYFTQVFVLFSHTQFSQGVIILGCSNVRSISELIENDIRQLTLNQIYCFDTVPSKLVIKVFEGQKVALLYGFHFSSEIFKEYLIKRIGRYYTRIQIQKSDFSKEIDQAVKTSESIFRPNKKSFILGSESRVICLSFLTIERIQRTNERMLVIIEELLLNQQILEWKIKSFSEIKFQLQYSQKMAQQIVKQPKFILKQLLDVYEITEGKDIFIVLSCQNYVFQGSINIQSIPKTSMLLFKPIQVQKENSLPGERFIFHQNYQNERLIDKPNGYHIYAKSIDKGVVQIQSQTQTIAEFGTNPSV